MRAVVLSCGMYELQLQQHCFTLGKLMMRIASNGHFFTQIPQPLEGHVREVRK